MTYETLLIENTDAVRTITLNRPDALNAFTETLKVELTDAVKNAGRDAGVRCVVLTGAGRAFCAGQDLKEVLESESDETLGASLRRLYNPLILGIRTLEKPVIAAVNGVAAGAGCSLALAADIRIASEKASFIQAFVRIGLVPDCGATFMLTRLMGLGRALEHAFTGDPLRAVEAERLGVVNRVVAPEDLMTATMELAARLSQAPTRAIGLTKRAMNRALTTDLEEALDYEAALQDLASRTQDFVEGVAAFTEKRTAQFVGK